MSKKGEIQEKILKKIGSGINTNKELRDKFKTLDRKKFWYHKEKLKEKGLIEEYEKGKFRVVIGPNLIADRKKTWEILNRIKSDIEVVREEAFYDFTTYLEKWVIEDPDVYDFIIRCMQDPSYAKKREFFMSFLVRMFGMVLGHPFEDTLREKLKENPDFLVEMALDKDSDIYKLRSYSINLLSEFNKERFIETALKIITDPDEPKFPELSLGSTKNSSNYVGYDIRDGAIRLPLQHLETFHKELYSLLEKHHDNKVIVERITSLLGLMRTNVMWGEVDSSSLYFPRIEKEEKKD